MLYNALHALRSQLPCDIAYLKPSRYFKKAELLSQRDILAYEAKLKEVLLGLLEQSNPQDPSSPIQAVIHKLQDDGVAQKDAISDTTGFLDNLLYLLSDLHANGDLVRCVLRMLVVIRQRSHTLPSTACTPLPVRP